MYLVDFLNEHKNWQELLAAKPYSLEIKQDGNFYLLKYNMIESDFTLPEVLEARGSIFTYINDKWVCVCRSLDKFGNWGESYAATSKIDWSKPVSVQEKVDGSIIRCWCWQGLWHVSTNGTIDAFKAECGDSTYGNVFYSIIEKYTTVRAFFNQLDPSYTYWFEMVHPQYNTIVVHYKEPAIYYLGCRNMVTMEEQELSPTELFYDIRTPQRFHYSNLDDVVEACHNMGEDEEGYVVCTYNQMENDSFLRIKCKGDEYLKRHKLRGNGPLTTCNFILMWQQETLDDFIAYFPEMQPQVSAISFSIQNLCAKADIAWSILKDNPDRKSFALQAKEYIKPIQSYLFGRLDNKCTNATEWFKKMNTRNLAAYISS